MINSIIVSTIVRLRRNEYEDNLNYVFTHQRIIVCLEASILALTASTIP